MFVALMRDDALLLVDWSWASFALLHNRPHVPVWVFNSRGAAQRAIRSYGGSEQHRMEPFEVTR